MSQRRHSSRNVNEDAGVVLNIKQICTKMRDEYGYEYAALTDSLKLEKQVFDLDVSDRPNDALFFSKLIDTYSDITDELDGLCAPHWFDWMELNDHELFEEYKHKHIMFAKYDKSRIVDLTRDKAFVLENAMEIKYGTWYYDWPNIKRHGFKGFIYDGENGWYDKFGSSWDVKTLAVWDTTALADIKSFNSALSLEGYSYHT